MNLLKKPCGIVAALVMGLLFCGAASATPVQFDIDGHFSNIDLIPYDGTFTGTMEVDTDTGELVSIEVLFPILAAFNHVQSSHEAHYLPRWTVNVRNISGDFLSLAFTTPQVPVSCFPFVGCWGPGSLVDFAGGSIIGNAVWTSIGGIPVVGAGFSGSITPAQASVPEPAALGMFGLGILLVGVFAGMRKRVHQN